MTERILNWGLLSTANINRALITPLRASPRNRLTAVASRDLAHAQAYAAERDIPPPSPATRPCWPTRTSTSSTSRCPTACTPMGHQGYAGGQARALRETAGGHPR